MIRCCVPIRSRAVVAVARRRRHSTRRRASLPSSSGVMERNHYCFTGCACRHSQVRSFAAAGGSRYHPPHNNQQWKNKHSNSNNNNVSESEIVGFCESIGVRSSELQRTPRHVYIKECPFCPKPTGGKADNLYKIGIKIGDGLYNCFRCGAQGNWNMFRQQLSSNSDDDNNSNSHDDYDEQQHRPVSKKPSRYREAQHIRNVMAGPDGTINCLPRPQHRIHVEYQDNLMKDQANTRALQYLTETRGLTLTTLRKYGVGKNNYNFDDGSGRYVPQECITFPWLMTVELAKEQESKRGATLIVPEEEEKEQTGLLLRRIKARSLDNKGKQRTDPTGGGLGLFGWHTVNDSKEVVLTEGEYDAMAVNQATGMPAVSLPSGCNSFSKELLPMFDNIDKVYVWLDNDAQGKKGADSVVEMLGLTKCYMIQHSDDGPKDANEALLKGYDLQEFLDDADIKQHDKVTEFKSFRDAVIHQLFHPNDYHGQPAPSLPGFTNVMKGFRPGELSIITGPTGSGKTTFLSQISIDFAEANVKTLWGSFEVKNEKLAHKMLQQYSRNPIDKDSPTALEDVEALCDSFMELPLYFLTFWGGTDCDEVLDAMHYVVDVQGVQHIILDNMQFMISRKSDKSSYDKFDAQDRAIESFRKFATEKNVHVTLVCHPRKEAEGTKLGINSFYGSAKASQEADLVLILQSDGQRKSIDVKKNRYDGTLGTTPLFFDPQSCRYMETPPSRSSSSSKRSKESNTGQQASSFADQIFEEVH